VIRIFLASLLFSTPAWSYLSFGGGADIPKGTLGGLEIQMLTDEGGGTLFNGFYEMPHGDEFSSRYSIGFGTIDYNLGASLKWTPFPDTKTQPAVGFRGSFWYAKYKEANITTIQVASIVSRKFSHDFGALVPFAALALNFNNVSGGGSNITGTQLSVGTELYHKDVSNMYFSAELGTSIKDASSFVGLSATVPMDGDKAFFKRR
jgi:hypothetical protein